MERLEQSSATIQITWRNFRKRHIYFLSCLFEAGIFVYTLHQVNNQTFFVCYVLTCFPCELQLFSQDITEKLFHII